MMKCPILNVFEFGNSSLEMARKGTQAAKMKHTRQLLSKRPQAFVRGLLFSFIDTVGQLRVYTVTLIVLENAEMWMFYIYKCEAECCRKSLSAEQTFTG